MVRAAIQYQMERFLGPCNQSTSTRHQHWGAREARSWTLGGFFALKTPKGTHRGFLTISNAVAPPSAAFDLNSSRPCAQTEGDLPAANVQYFAQQDCNESIKSGKRHLKSYGARLSEAEAEEKESRAKGDSTSHTPARLQECTQGYRDMVHTVKQQINQVEQMPVNLGRTILASQHYAFVETTALPHAIDNTLPEVSLVHACADPEETWP